MTWTLVTGASGFVGSYLLQELQKQGIRVKGVSRTAKTGLFQVPTYGPEMDWAPLLGDVDTIIHLAARVHLTRDRARDPLSEFRKANVEATLHLARAAAQAGVRRFIFVSTIKVNGETTKAAQPFRADDPPAPQGPYAVSKAEAEAALFDLGTHSGMEVVVIRPPLVYGQGAKGNMATLEKWGKFHPPSPFGSIKNRRSLVHLSNLSSAILAAHQRKEAANQIFLVADSQPISTHDILLDFGWTQPSKMMNFLLSNTVLRLLAVHAAMKNRLLDNLEVDIEKTRSMLQWNPSAFVRQKSRKSE